MRKITSIILTLSLMLAFLPASAQRSVKNVRFDGIGLANSPESFVSKL